MALRRCWSSSTRSRTAAGSCARCHSRSLARRQRGELRRIGHLAGRRVRQESRLARVTHPQLAADPGPAGVDGLTGPAVARLVILKQVQHVLGAQEGPVGQQPVVLVR
jgi:hypothetical protein